MSVGTSETSRTDSVEQAPAPRSGRVDLAIPVDMLIGDRSWAAITKNISAAGAFIATRRLLPVGARIALRLAVPTCSVPLVVEAEVRWLRSAVWGSADGRPAGMGVRFVDPPIGIAHCLGHL